MSSYRSSVSSSRTDVEKPRLYGDSSNSKRRSVLGRLNSSNIQPSTESNREIESWHPREGKQRSDDIDRYLAAESAKLERENRILVFGDRHDVDVFWKLCKLFADPPTVGEKDSLREGIRTKVVQTAEAFVTALYDGVFNTYHHEKVMPLATAAIAKSRLENLPKAEDDQREYAESFLELYSDEIFYQQLQELHLAWQDKEDKHRPSWFSPNEIERSVLTNGTHPHLSSCNCDTGSIEKLLWRVFNNDYKPTDHDYLHFSPQVFGTYAREVKLAREAYDLRILDIRGGSGERKKWIHLFEDASCVIFVADLSLYDQSLSEDSSVSRLHEAIILFESVAGSRWFQHAPVVLVLAARNAFEKKLEKCPLQASGFGVAYDEYKRKTGGDNAVEFMTDVFLKSVKRSGVHTIVTELWDPENAKEIIEFMERTALGKPK